MKSIFILCLVKLWLCVQAPESQRAGQGDSLQSNAIGQEEQDQVNMDEAIAFHRQLFSDGRLECRNVTYKISKHIPTSVMRQYLASIRHNSNQQSNPNVVDHADFEAACSAVCSAEANALRPPSMDVETLDECLMSAGFCSHAIGWVIEWVYAPMQLRTVISNVRSRLSIRNHLWHSCTLAMLFAKGLFYISKLTQGKDGESTWTPSVDFCEELFGDDPDYHNDADGSRRPGNVNREWRPVEEFSLGSCFCEAYVGYVSVIHSTAGQQLLSSQDVLRNRYLADIHAGFLRCNPFEFIVRQLRFEWQLNNVNPIFGTFPCTSLYRRCPPVKDLEF